MEADIAATPPTNIHAIDPPDLRRFYAVEAFDAPPPPPLFFADFETGADDFTTVTDAGSAWEWGAPDSDNQSNPIPLPAVALDRAIRLEWRFTGGSNAFIGWYLDDVAVFTE